MLSVETSVAGIATDAKSMLWPRKKQTGSRAAALDPAAVWRGMKPAVGARLDGRRFARTSCRLREGLKLDLEAELGELGDETLGFDLGRPAVEVVGAEVLVEGAVLQHVVDRGQHRGGDSADGFLRAALAAQSVELRPVVAVFPAARR